MKKIMNYRFISYLTGILLFGFLIKPSEANTSGNSWQLIANIEKNLYSHPELVVKSVDQVLKMAAADNDSLAIAKAYYFKGIYHVYAGSVAKGETWLETAKKIGKNIHNKELMVDCLLELGEVNYNKGMFDKALNLFFEASKMSKVIKYKQGEAAALNYIGKYHHSKGNFKRSHNYYMEALHIASTVKDVDHIIYIKNNLGKHYETLALYEKAMSQYTEVYKMLDQTSNKVLKATTFNHLGNIYEKINDYDLALHYHLNALQHRKEIKYLEGIAKSEKNIGEIYEKQNKLDTALLYYQNSYHRCKGIGYKKGMIKSLYLSGNVNRKKGQLEEAETLYMKAIELSEEIGYEKGNLYSYLNISKLYLARNNHQLARNYLEKGINLSESDDLTGIAIEFYDAMHQLLTSLNDYEHALEYYKLYADTRDDLLNEEKNRNIEKMKIAVETERKEQQNKILRQENELKNLALQRKNAMMIAIGIALVLLAMVTGMIYFRFKNKDRANQALEELNNRISEKNKQLASLNKELDNANKEKDKFFSIIAHELRNPLWWFKNLSETLSEKYHELDKEKIQKTLDSLNDSAKTAFHLIDNLLQWSRSQLGRLKYRPAQMDLTGLVFRNVDLFKQEAQHKNIDIFIHLDEGKKVFIDQELTDTVFRNLISNAIKYTPDGGKITIESKILDEFAEITIKDTGIGISKANQKKLFNPRVEYTTLGLYQEKGSGLGLLLCKDFIEMNGGTIWFESDEGKGTAFYITLPLAMEEVLV